MKTLSLLLLVIVLISCKPKSSQGPDLVGYWSFDNSTATLAPDQSANIIFNRRDHKDFRKVRKVVFIFSALFYSVT